MFRRFGTIQNQLRILKRNLIPAYSLYSRNIACWKCNHENATKIFCEKCNVLQKPDTTKTYFDILEMNMSFEINSTQLVANFHKMQVLFHPDKHGNRSEEEKHISENYSTLINKAYQTLSDDVKRGYYILQIKGCPVIGDSAGDTSRVLLVEVLKINEEIEFGKSRRNLYRLKNRITKVYAESLELATEAFKRNNLEEARKFVIKLKYYSNAIKKLQDKLERVDHVY